MTKKQNYFTSGLYCIIVFLYAFFFASIALAQPLPPSNSQPGSQSTRFEDQSMARQHALERKKPKAPQIDIEEEKKEAPKEAGPKFVLNGVKVAGSTLFKDEDFKSAYADYIGKEVTWADVEAIVEKVKDVYKKEGYLTTVVYIPEQDIVGGEIEIRILEGKVGEVTVEGNKWFSSDLIKKYFHSKKNEILNIFKMEKDMLRLNQNPDLEVRSVVAPGKDPGFLDVTLKVTEKFPYHAGSAFDNQGTRLVGKLRTAISARSSNLSGHNDTLFVNTLWSALSQGNFASYLLPIDTYGTKVGMDFVVYDSLLGKEYKGFQITGNTQTYTPKVVAEMHLSEKFNANAEAGMDIKSIKRWVQGNKSSDDQLRMPYASLNFSNIDSFAGGGQTSLVSKFVFSTSEFLGASRHDHGSASRLGTGGFFFQYMQTIRRIQKMPADSYLSARAQFMNATDTLPSSEQIQFGGAYSVRGYPEGDYSADYGAGLNVEWIFPLFFVPKDFKLPYSETPLCHQFEPVVFMDMAGGKIKKPGPGERETKFLMGIGGGLKVQINRNVFLNLYWAERVGDRPSANQGPSNFNISFQCEI